MGTFQDNLRYYREKAGYKTAKDFAKALNFPYTTYLSYENAGKEPKFNTLVKIADTLGITTDELLGHVRPAVFSSSIPEEVAIEISRKADKIRNSYINDCLKWYAYCRKQFKKKGTSK